MNSTQNQEVRLPKPWIIQPQIRYVAYCDRYMCDWNGFPWSDSETAEEEAIEHATVNHNDSRTNYWKTEST